MRDHGFLFAEYEAFTQEMLRYYTGKIPRPQEMAEDQYTRTLRARAFDNSRYLLPLATNTSLGQIVNARTLETQIARLLSSPYAEVRASGRAAEGCGAANLLITSRLNPCARWWRRSRRPILSWARRPSSSFCVPRVWRPTLVKYAKANEYESQTRVRWNMPPPN